MHEGTQKDFHESGCGGTEGKRWEVSARTVEGETAMTTQKVPKNDESAGGIIGEVSES